MTEKKFNRIVRPATEEERNRHAAIRKQVSEEVPPLEGSGREEAPPGLPSRIRQAREARNLTWFALAELAGVPDSGTIRDLESGRDVPLSALQSVARALGLRLELVEEKV